MMLFLKRLTYFCFRVWLKIKNLVSEPKRMADSTFTAIIFSKDRPLQLQALLQSMPYYVNGSDAQLVLYRSSNPAYETAYTELKSKFPSVSFVRESSFRKDLLIITKTLSTPWVFFLVDDLIFTDQLDLKTLPPEIPDEAIISLRLHPGVTFSYMMKTAQEKPEFREICKDTYQFNWLRQGVDWAYPLSVDGHIFDRNEIRLLMKLCNFKAPNSLEASLQVFNKFICSAKTGVCFQTPKIINFPMNRVQNEFANVAGEISTKELLRLYNEGYELDYLHFQKCAYNSVHVEADLKLKQR